MSAFDALLNVVNQEVGVDEENPTGVQVALDLGLVVPIVVDPHRPPAGALVQLGRVRFNIEDAAVAKAFGEALVEAAEKLPAKSNVDIAIASNLNQVEETAKRLGLAA